MRPTLNLLAVAVLATTLSFSITHPGAPHLPIGATNRAGRCPFGSIHGATHHWVILTPLEGRISGKASAPATRDSSLIKALPTEAWGFFAHRRINRLAVFTLPPDMMVFYRPHLEYLTEHAVDPDKRRYATRHEAVRHYIDLDVWGRFPFPDLPRNWTEALLRHATLHESGPANGIGISLRVDTIIRQERTPALIRLRVLPGDRSYELPLTPYRELWQRLLLPQYYEETWTLPGDSLALVLADSSLGGRTFIVTDHLSEYGILPYQLWHSQQRLTEAFRRRDAEAILKLSADIGHYIGDAHVPLHTTSNYNGQLTGQLGIHAFWESRLPELFADAEYDFFVGKAQYLRSPRDDFWQIVLDSHQLVDSVLNCERRLRHQFPADQQFCFDDRQGITVHTQCREYARAYQSAMGSMVEDRLRAAILAVGSAWYSAWVDAGQPKLEELLKSPAQLARDSLLEQSYRMGKGIGRPHED